MPVSGTATVGMETGLPRCSEDFKPAREPTMLSILSPQSCSHSKSPLQQESAPDTGNKLQTPSAEWKLKTFEPQA
jgi:hypothetical protein